MPDYIVKFVREDGEKQQTTKIFAPSYSDAEKDAQSLIKKRKKGRIVSIDRDEKEHVGR